jgi:hypothetical protein
MINRIFKMSGVAGKACAVVAALALSGAAVAQHEVAFSTESGQPGDTVTVDFTFTNTGGTDSALEARARISDVTVFSSIDASNLCSGSGADFVSCELNDTNRLVVTATNFDASNALADFSGTVDFTIDAGATPPQTIDIVWDAPADSGETYTPTAETDGQIDITSGPQSTLSLTPAAIDFMTVDLGNMPVTDTFTLENTGDAATTVNVSGVSYSGDAEFSILTDNCSGQALPADGTTCDVVIEFDAGANGVYSGQIDVTSDANNNADPTGNIDGEADSVADLSVNPPFGPVDLGTVVLGSSATANGSISNNGSADGDFTCTLTGDPEISTTPSPLSGTVPAGGSADFSLTCAVPDTASEGDTFNATLECSGDNGFGGTHDISCTATEFVPFPVPSMNKWGLAVLALLMVMVGGITVRFFRA